MPPPETGSNGVLTGLQLAARYPSTLPTWRQIASDFGVSAATAGRYLHSMKLARGMETRRVAAPKIARTAATGKHPWREKDRTVAWTGKVAA